MIVHDLHFYKQLLLTFVISLTELYRTDDENNTLKPLPETHGVDKIAIEVHALINST